VWLPCPVTAWLRERDASVSDAGQGTDAARVSGQRDAAPSDLGAEDSTRVDTGVDAGADAGADAGHEAAAAIDTGDPCARTGLPSFKISNLPPGLGLPAINGVTPAVGPQTFNTDNGAFGGGGSIGTSTTSSVADGPRVLHVTNLTVTAGTEFILSGNRTLIIVADDAVTIAGTMAGAGGYAGATGAGSGGSILLEAPSITVGGALAAHGGGGGQSSLGSADIGEWRSITSTPAAGGDRGGERGGAGGAGASPPEGMVFRRCAAAVEVEERGLSTAAADGSPR
jgi:hypothetical protein